MELLIEILKSVGVGFIGIIFYTLLKSTKYFVMWNPFRKIKPKLINKWSFRKLAGENFGAWAWALLMIVIMAVVAELSPETLSALESLGFSVTEEIGSFLTLGFTLSIMVKEAKDSIGGELPPDDDELK